MNALSKLFFEFRLSLHQRGLKNTFLISIATLHGYWEDYRDNLTTASWMSVEKFGVDMQQQQNSSPYAPTTNLSLKGILDKLAIDNRQVFLDLGCGKGRVLIFAALEGFMDIRGVEFSPVLQQLAKDNCQHFLGKKFKKAKSIPKITVLEMDVRNYHFKGDETIIFMFDPFSKEVLEVVVENMKKSLSSVANKMTIIYRSPVHKIVFDNDNAFTLILEDSCWGHKFSVYELSNVD